MKRKRIAEKNEQEWFALGSNRGSLKKANTTESKVPIRPTASSSTVVGQLNGTDGPRRSTRQRGRPKKTDFSIEASSIDTIKEIKKKVHNMIYEYKLIACFIQYRNLFFVVGLFYV